MKFMKEHLQTIITILICILTIPLILYIFIGSKAWLNSDSAFIVDYAIDAIEAHSLLPNTWINSNDFWVYSLIPIMTIFIKMGMNLLFARQLSVFIQSVVLFFVLYELLHNVMKDKLGFKVVLLMIVSGISGQFLFELFGDATYGSIILYMLISLLLFIRYQATYNKKYIILMGLFLLIISTFSLRFPIYIGAPIICCGLYAIYEEGFKKEHLYTIGACIIAIGCGFLLNTLLRHNLIFIDNYKYSGVIHGSEHLMENLFSFIYNYLFISGATYQNIHGLTYFQENSFLTASSSPLIVLTFIKIIFSLFNMVIPILLFKKVKKMTNEEKNYYIFITSFVLILMFFMIIGSMTWYRYITIIVFYLLLLYPLIYKYYFEKKEKNRVVFFGMILLFISVSVFFSGYSYFKLREFKFRENNFQELIDFLEEKNLTQGYALRFNESNIYRLLSNGKVQIVGLSTDGKSQDRWLASTRWVEEDYYQGRVFLIMKYDQDPIGIEELATEKYDVEKYNSYIYVFDDNKIIIDNMKGK